METFLPYSLNKAERNQDASKLYSLGKFAWVLQLISKEGYLIRAKKDKLSPLTFVYRGVKLPKNVFEDYKDKKNKNEKL